jgi:hypothetical protein
LAPLLNASFVPICILASWHLVCLLINVYHNTPVYLQPDIAASEEDHDQFDQPDEATEVALYKSRQQQAPASTKVSVHGAAPAAGAGERCEGGGTGVAHAAWV